MRERITFFQRAGAAFDPAELQVTDLSIGGPSTEAAREDRLTFSLEDLPTEVRGLLSECHELHIRWVAPRSFEVLSPLLSRLSPGFHIFYTPRHEAARSPRLCTALNQAFGDIKCSTPAESFTSLPHDRFSHSTAYQYFQPLETLDHFINHVQTELCSPKDLACSMRAALLAEAASLDVSYDIISQTVRITALSPFASRKVDVTANPDHRTEVGILRQDKPPNLEAHHVGMSGVLTVLGEHAKPSPTVFSFPSRHRDAESAFSATFLQPTGLHPTMQIRIDSNKAPAGPAHCSMHAYFTLPRTIFPDKYQLANPLFLASKNLTALRYISEPIDLEAPEYVVKTWGSSMLLELSPPPETARPQRWTAEIPLHLRYLEPNLLAYQNIQVPHPVVFWACAAEEGTKFPNNPFDRTNLGYDGLFGPRTAFWHAHPRSVDVDGRIVSTIRVPVLNLEKSPWVNTGTAVVVLLGFAWVTWKLLAVSLATRRTAPVRTTAEDKKTR